MLSPRPSRSLLAVAVTVITQLFAPNRATAQIAPVAQYNYGSDVTGQAVSGLGAGIRVPLNSWNQQRGLMGMFTFDYFFAPNYPVTDGSLHEQTYWEVNMNGTYDLPGLKPIYLGGGLNYTQQSVAYTGNVPGVIGSNLGLNVLAGLHFGSRKAGGFVQGRAELGGGKQFVATAGVYF